MIPSTRLRIAAGTTREAAACAMADAVAGERYPDQKPASGENGQQVVGGRQAPGGSRRDKARPRPQGSAGNPARTTRAPTNG